MKKRQFSGIFRSDAKSRFMGRRCAFAMLVAFSVTMSGCALQQEQNPSGSIIGGPTHGTQLSTDLNGFLNQPTPGNIVLEDSPWGANVEVMADEPYDAATGRVCRKLEIMSQRRSNARSVLACQTADGSWISQRLVTQVQAKGTTQ